MSQANMNNLSNGEISFKIDWTPEQKKAFKDITGFTELDDDYIKIEQLLKLVEKQLKEMEILKDNNIKHRKALLYMLNQFAYDEKRNKEEDEPLFTGGLSALEEAFDVLNIKEGISRKELWKMIQELLEE